MKRILIDHSSDTAAFRRALQRKNPDAVVVDGGGATFGAPSPVTPGSTEAARPLGDHKTQRQQ